jgi:hypothetical protein
VNDKGRDGVVELADTREGGEGEEDFLFRV